MAKSEKKSKEKKHHKDKSHKKTERKKDKRKSKGSHCGDESADLSLLLTYGLLKFPELFAEIPQMLMAMDTGECINVDAISNAEKRKFLHALFGQPSMQAKLHPGSGWAKAEECNCIRRAVLNSMLSNGDVINPQDLSPAQTRAARMAPVLQQLLKEIPQLISELGDLLKMVCSGETLDLGGMENKDVKKALSKCLKDIGVDQPDGGKKYAFCLPEYEEEIVRDALKQNAEVLIAVKGYEENVISKTMSVYSADLEGNKTIEEWDDPGAVSGSGSSVSSESEDDESDSSSAGPRQAGTGLKGPARPTADQLVAASVIAKQMHKLDSDSDQSESEFAISAVVGPVVPTGGIDVQNNAAGKSLLLGALGAEGFDLSGPRISSADCVAGTTVSTGGREEWMLTPGENKPSGGIENLFKSGKNKFEAGKEAKKAAAALKAEREAVARLMEDPEEKNRTEAFLQEYREKRGPSLMDAHLDKLGKRPKTVDTRLKSFDHEKEMGGHRKMNIKDVQGMVATSKELDSRFDKASVQKTFL